MLRRAAERQRVEHLPISQAHEPHALAARWSALGAHGLD